LLVEAVLQLAKSKVERYGDFAVYGGLLQQDHSVVYVGLTESSRSPAVVSIDALRRELRHRVERGEAIAVAIVLGVRIVPPGEEHASAAIEVLVQHRDAYCADMFYPYRVIDGAVRLGQVFAQTCGKQILA
jgi:hypothetical protein